MMVDLSDRERALLISGIKMVIVLIKQSRKEITILDEYRMLKEKLEMM